MVTFCYYSKIFRKDAQNLLPYDSAKYNDFN